MPETKYTAVANADPGNLSAASAPGTQANPSRSYAGKSETGKALIGKHDACPRPGSNEWYTEATEPRLAGSVVGDRHHDLVGVWSTRENAFGTTRTLVVTPRHIEQESPRAYEVLAATDAGLIVRAHPPLPGVEGSEFEVRFQTRDRMKFAGVEMKRYDCRGAGPHADLCCRLPRERWVVLGPD
jgi:hypothetical protein